MYCFMFAYLNGADSYSTLQLIDFHSNDMNSLKRLFLKKERAVIVINKIVINAQK